MENFCKGFDDSLLETGVSVESTCHFWLLNYFAVDSLPHRLLMGVAERDNGLVKISLGKRLEAALREIWTPSIVRWVSILNNAELLKGHSGSDRETVYCLPAYCHRHP